MIFRLVWVRMVDRERPAFMQDWRSLALISMTIIAMLAVFLLATNQSNTPNTSEQTATQSQLTGKPSVAVLPLNSLSEDPEQGYLADGITEDVITLLSRNPRFFVIARNSTFGYKGKSPDIRTVGKDLGVRYVVEGSLRKMGKRLRVTVQLIDTNNGQHIWAEQYDRPFVEIFDLQDEITNGIAVALGDEIFQAEIARAQSTSTDNLDAWGLVMRANEALTNWNNESSKNATVLFSAALALDPNYALAKAGLARTLCWRASNMWSKNPDEDIAMAYKLSEQALKLAHNDPLVLFGVGACYGATGRPDEAIRLLKKAVTLQPNFAMALGVLGYSYAFNEQPELGLPYSEKALQLAPQSPYIWLYETWRSVPLLELGRYEEAMQASQNALESYDGWWWTWINLATARAGQGDIEGAKQALYTARKKEALFSLSFTRGVSGIVYKNKGENVLALLEPIWPEELLTADK